MKEKLQELKQIIYNRLPARWGLRLKLQQITSSISQLYEFKLQIINPDHAELNRIRQMILLNPYTVSTRPVRIKIDESDKGKFELTISFVVMNPDHGKQIEDSIRERYLSKNGNN
jgi:hypothetical protein